MNEDARVNPGYAAGQMAKALVTALAHEDAATRRRAEERLGRWERVVSGMKDGSLDIGSRTPVAGLPAWVTPEVVRGGFATGDAAAGGPLLDHELEAARRAGVPAARQALFAYHLTDAGLAELYELLDSGRYEVVLPEEAALLAVAWLLRAGDRAAALDVLDAIGPFAGRLRFLPRPARSPGDPSLVRRKTAGQVRERLAARRPNRAVATMNEALSVWNPFADELLAHWLETVRDGRILAAEPDGWRARGAALLDRYAELAARHTLCGKHRNPRANLAILRVSLKQVLDGQPPSGLLQHAVDSMVAKRGVPGGAEHAALREQQAAEAARPTHHALAQAVARRLEAVPQDGGVPSIDPFVAPVTTGGRTTEVPERLRRVAENALEAPVSTLVERGVVPSAEVLARLVPQLVAAASARPYPDDALKGLMAAVHKAFRNRRSLLLLDLAHQVRQDELPWVAAVAGYRRTTGAAQANAHAVLVQLGELALRSFPGTIVPNPMIGELGTLADRAGVRVPFVEELAADIFMGRFSPKFLQAAQLAGEVMEGTLYARYYGIDYAAVRRLRDGFGDLCAERAGDLPASSWVVANGMVIEQAQILTTHNLAALVHPVGIQPAGGWDGLARRAFGVVCRLVRRVQGNPYPLRTVKDAAYAWRQAVFFLALCGLKEQIAAIAWMQDELDRQPSHAVRRLDPVLAGLRHVLTGGALDAGPSPRGRRFLGWSAGGHWMF
ncbi:transcriptional regulator [Actinomadura madurae]|uniref:transcriptional regulator n=1 Tax=Actinomadura madurae TaxID=1993 RepID=UPI0020D1FC82|nr:transcriptional regulator [Actinomadura madurae]MCP9979147.1 transcriptional regulator [Actinomadura madurae]MCQ0009323.1 transcriptional regulator [Actinomadura madurae]